MKHPQRRPPWRVWLAGAFALVGWAWGQPPALAQFPPSNPLRVPESNFPDGFGFKGGSYTFAIEGEVRTFNPFLAVGHPLWQQAGALAGVTRYPALLDGFFGEPIRLTGGMAEAFEVESGTPETRVVMRLRQGLRWSDGQPLDCQDVAFTVAAYTDPRFLRVSGAMGLMVGDRLPGFACLDPLRFAFSFLDGVDVGPYLVQLNGLTLLPRHTHQAAFDSGALGSETYWDAAFAQQNPQRLVGAGPFRLHSGAPGVEWVFERNPYYWKVDGRDVQLPYFNAVRMVVEEHGKALLRFISGDLDQISPQPADLPLFSELIDNGQVAVAILPPDASAVSNFLTFNQDVGLTIARGLPVSEGDPYRDSLRQLFRNPLFRRAVSQATDRTQIAESVFLGLAEPIWQMLGLGPFDVSGHPASAQPPDPSYPAAYLNHDPEAANQLLDEIDLPLGTSGVRVFGQSYPAAGRPVRIRLGTNQETAERVLSAQLLAETYATALSLEVVVEAVSFGDALKDLLSFPTSGTFGRWEAFYLGISGGGVDPTVAFSPLVSSGPLHVYRYSDTIDPNPPLSQLQLDFLWREQATLPHSQAPGEVGGLPGTLYPSAPERFELVRQMQLHLAQLQDLIFTVAAQRATAYHVRKLGNVIHSGYEAQNPTGSLLSFFECGYRLDANPGSKGNGSSI